MDSGFINLRPSPPRASAPASSSDANIDESQNSLTYATRVRTIKNDARK
jgi:hypothetical protein